MSEIVLYFFRTRDELTGKWRQTRYRLTDDEARKRFGEGNYERLDSTREVRTGGHKSAKCFPSAKLPDEADGFLSNAQLQ